jgi:hypothetical protein
MSAGHYLGLGQNDSDSLRRWRQLVPFINIPNLLVAEGPRCLKTTGSNEMGYCMQPVTC